MKNIEKVALIAAISTYNAVKKTAQEAPPSLLNKAVKILGVSTEGGANPFGGGASGNVFLGGNLQITMKTLEDAKTVFVNARKVSNQLAAIGVKKITLDCEQAAGRGTWEIDIVPLGQWVRHGNVTVEQGATPHVG
jgi:hypothetical protein